jgi:hypothetical protein
LARLAHLRGARPAAAARAGVPRRWAEGRQHLACHPRDPGAPRGMRRRRLYGREPDHRSAHRHRRLHHLRGIPSIALGCHYR